MKNPVLLDAITGFLCRRWKSMEIPRLIMQSQMGRIAMQSTNGRQELSQPQADLLMEQPSAQLRIQTKKPSLLIDQTEAFADAGLKSVKRVIAEQAQRGYQAFLQGVGRRAAQGSELMKIENGGQAIIRQAEANAYEGIKNIGVSYIPNPLSVQIAYDPGNVDIQVTIQKPRIHAVTRPVEASYVRSDLSIYMVQSPSLHIGVEPKFFERI